MKKSVYFFSFCINHNLVSLATKALRAHICSTTNPKALPKHLKKAPTTLPTIAGNGSEDRPASLLRASASMFSHLVKTSSSFGDPDATGPPHPKTSVIASIIVQKVIKRAVSIDIIVIRCSQNKVRILSAKYVSLSRTFSMVCFILATCV